MIYTKYKTIKNLRIYKQKTEPRRKIFYILRTTVRYIKLHNFARILKIKIDILPDCWVDLWHVITKYERVVKPFYGVSVRYKSSIHFVDPYFFGRGSGLIDSGFKHRV